MTGELAATSLFPVIRYRDVPGAIAFLESAFGFEQWMMVPGPEGTIMHAELAFGSSIVMLGTIDQSKEPERGSPWISLYLAVGDIDAHFWRAKAAGAVIVKEPFDTDYGSRDYTALDTEGYTWYFGTYRPVGPSPSTS
jgi:uncharacterized glyoxalase superfamily protein PhnB